MNRFDLYVSAGNSGAGKTTLGQYLAKRFDVESIDPDLIRRDLGHTDYFPGRKSEVAREFSRRLEEGLLSGRPTVLSSPFMLRADRESVCSVLKDTSLQLGRTLRGVFIWCECSQQEAERRIASRPPKDHLHRPSNDVSIFRKFASIEEARDERSSAIAGDFSYIAFNSETGEIRPEAVRSNHDHAITKLNALIMASYSCPSLGK